MSLDRYARAFFEKLKEYRDDPSGESLYTDAARQGLHEIALPFFADLPDDFTTLLDVGCGAGFDAAWFAQRGKQVTAITGDPAPAQLRYAETHGFTLRDMDMNALAFPDASFDAILCKHVLEHSISPLASLWELRRVLKPHGYLFLVLPPHSKKLVESGHFTQGWSLGQIVYVLCVTGYDVADGAFRARPGNLEAVVRPAPAVPDGRGLFALGHLMPAPIRPLMSAELHGAFPANAFTQIAWPFRGRRETVAAAPEPGPPSLRRMVRQRLQQHGLAGRALARLMR